MQNLLLQYNYTGTKWLLLADVPLKNCSVTHLETVIILDIIYDLQKLIYVI